MTKDRLQRKISHLVLSGGYFLTSNLEKAINFCQQHSKSIVSFQVFDLVNEHSKKLLGGFEFLLLERPSNNQSLSEASARNHIPRKPSLRFSCQIHTS